MHNEEKLKAIREKIDLVDQQIGEMINRRAKFALEIGKLKSKDNCFYCPEREVQVRQKVAKENKGPLKDDQMVDIFRTIMSACLNLQKGIQVAYLGPAGSFSHTAVLKHFGKTVKAVPEPSIGRVFRQVELGEVDYGVVPIENSTTGMIDEILEYFVNTSLEICAEMNIPIQHNLIRAQDANEPIEKVYAHSQALQQCSEWLNRHLPVAVRIPTLSNTEGVKIAQGEKESAAIAGKIAAECYSMNIIECNIQDNPQNQSRFVVFCKQKTKPTGRDKTSLLISPSTGEDCLIDLFELLKVNKLSIKRFTTIRERSKNWSYLYFVDLEGHQDEERFIKFFKVAKKLPIEIQLLGSYRAESNS